MIIIHVPSLSSSVNFLHVRCVQTLCWKRGWESDDFPLLYELQQCHIVGLNDKKQQPLMFSSDYIMIKQAIFVIYIGPLFSFSIPKTSWSLIFPSIQLCIYKFRTDKLCWAYLWCRCFVIAGYTKENTTCSLFPRWVFHRNGKSSG